MEKKNWLTLKTKAGCWHLFLILVAAILVFSFCAQMILPLAAGISRCRR